MAMIHPLAAQIQQLRNKIGDTPLTAFAHPAVKRGMLEVADDILALLVGSGTPTPEPGDTEQAAPNAPDKPTSEALRGRSAHYSGNDSVAFWREVNDRGDRTLYLMGCALEDIEGRMLQALEHWRVVAKQSRASLEDGRLGRSGQNPATKTPTPLQEPT